MSVENYKAILLKFSLREIYDIIKNHFDPYIKTRLENQRENEFRELEEMFNFEEVINDDDLINSFMDELFKIFERTILIRHHARISRLRRETLEELENREPEYTNLENFQIEPIPINLQTINIPQVQISKISNQIPKVVIHENKNKELIPQSTNVFENIKFQSVNENKEISKEINVPHNDFEKLDDFIKNFSEYTLELINSYPYVAIKLILDDGTKKYILMNTLSGYKFFQQILKDKFNIETPAPEDEFASNSPVSIPEIDSIKSIQFIKYQKIRENGHLEGGFFKYSLRFECLEQFSKHLGIYYNISKIPEVPCLINSIREINEINKENKNILTEDEINELYLSAFKNSNYITTKHFIKIAKEYNITFKIHFVKSGKEVKLIEINKNKNSRFTYELILADKHIMPFIKIECSGIFINNFLDILEFSHKNNKDIKEFFFTSSISKNKFGFITKVQVDKEKCNLTNSLNFFQQLEKQKLLKLIEVENFKFDKNIEIRLRNECEEKINDIYKNPSITKENTKLLKEIIKKTQNKIKFLMCIYADIECCFKDNEHIPFMLCFNVVQYDNNLFRTIKVFEGMRIIIKNILISIEENEKENINEEEFDKLIKKYNLLAELTNNNKEIKKEQFPTNEIKVELVKYLSKLFNENTTFYKQLLEKYNNSNNYKVIESRTLYGFNCCEHLLAAYNLHVLELSEKLEIPRQQVADRTLCYFHNLGYDGRFFLKYNVNNVINKGKRFISETVTYNGTRYKFKDSYSLLTMKLERFPTTFPTAFKGEHIHKEVFPYKYYTFDRVEKAIKAHLMYELDILNNKQVKRTGNTGNILEALEYIPTKEKQKEFIENLKNVFNIKTIEEGFDLISYCEFYCQQDVNILMKGFEEFRKICLIYPINIDVHKCLTAPSLANKYFTDRVYSKIQNYYYFNGSIQNYFMKAIYGGRCMSRDNKIWNLKNVKLDDFDACSLYPSAMARMFLPTGKPIDIYETKDTLKLFAKNKIYNKNNLPNLLKYTMDVNQKYPNKEKFISYFIIEIQITKIGIKRHFPLIVKKDKKGNNYVNECVNMFIDTIMLEDLIKFQDISFKILNGYYFTGIKDFRIRHTITELYNMRLEYKKTKNPLQEVIKLIMNSSYGKTIQKPIETTYKGKPKEKLDEYVQKSFYSLISLTEFNFNNVIERRIDETGNYNIQPIRNEYNTVLIKESKPTVDQFNNCIAGVIILSMSKRIMNEVMCLAEDLDIKIYYQDTDSMHIEHDKINLLAEEYKKLYNRELIGKNMGQFHNDFDELPDGYSTELIILGKKMYVDRLKDEKGNTSVHYRMKGIPQDVVKFYSKELHKEETNEIEQIIKLYEDIYNGTIIKMNICINKEMFNMNMNGTITSMKEFIREIKNTGLENK